MDCKLSAMREKRVNRPILVIHMYTTYLLVEPIASDRMGGFLLVQTSWNPFLGLASALDQS